jgi:cobalt-zinc-cadmium efflux system membrane fusion protein
VSRLIVVVLCTLTILWGCRSHPKTDQPAAPSAAQQGQPAAGNENAMCTEHGVLEAVCTKCKPALIPVFKAKEDWCEEHGFPESFCPICHPDRAGRPTNEVASDGDGPAEGTMVRFKTKETARLAGLHFAKAIEQATSREVMATARVVYDATRVAQINPRMPGVVRAIQADVGAKVKAGTPLATIESADVGAEQSRLQAARARLQIAETNLARVESMRSEGISSERQVLEAQQEREVARAELRTAQTSLGMVGAAADGSSRYTLTSPLTGVVTHRGATIGRMVDGEDTVFEVVDASEMWIEIDVPEAELPLIALDQPVVVTIDGLPGREFKGTLSYIAPSVDSRTRTAVARIPIANSDGALRANSFGQARIAVTDPRASVLVPRSAVQRARSVNLVFVKVAEDAFEARRVKIAPGGGDPASVSGRIQAGEEVVTEGSFLLKTETLKESIGAGCCDVE